MLASIMPGTRPHGVVQFAEIADLVASLAWPALVAIVLWRLLPTIQEVVRSRGFTVNVAGMEISVQQASEALGSRVEDLREQISALKAQVRDDAPAGQGHEMSGATSPISVGVPRLSAILWVDDFPENNAFEVATMQRKGVQILQARSTHEALQHLERQDVDAVITDMGREGDGPDAGLDLLRRIGETRPGTPVLIYASAVAVARTRAEAERLGAAGCTSSATELLDMLGRLNTVQRVE